MIKFLLLAARAIPLAVATLAAKDRPPLRVAPSVDLARYAGKWYEIARLPTWFQRACESGTTATYTVRPDGKVDVVNSCRKKDGSLKSVRGTAGPAGGNEPNTKLKVISFGPSAATTGLSIWIPTTVGWWWANRVAAISGSSAAPRESTWPSTTAFSNAPPRRVTSWDACSKPNRLRKAPAFDTSIANYNAATDRR